MNPILSQAQIRLIWRKKPSADWLPVGVSLRDPTGNVLVPYIESLAHHGDQEVIQFSGAFCSDEPIWKLRLDLAPCTLASIDPADLWFLPPLAIPGPDVFSRATAQFSRYGATVHLRGIAGRRTRDHSSGNSPPAMEASWAGTTVHLKSMHAVPGLQLMLVRAVDDHGRSIQPPGIGDTRHGEGNSVFTLQTAPGTEEVTLVFALVKGRFVEFVVRPMRAHAAAGES